MSDYILSAFADEANDDFSNQLNALKQNDIKFIDIRTINGKHIIDYSVGEQKNFKHELDKNGIKVFCLGSPIGKVDINAPINQELERLDRAITCAKIFDTNYIRIFSFFMEEEQIGKYQSKVLQNLGRLIDMAKSQGITLCHENEKGIFGAKCEQIVTLMDAFEKKLFFIFDAANFVQCNEDAYANFIRLKNRTNFYHIKDAKKDGQVVAAGEGACQISKIVKTLYNAGEKFYLTLEPHLYQFNGLKGLQKEDLLVDQKYSSQIEAFNAGAKNLKIILQGVNEN